MQQKPGPSAMFDGGPVAVSGVVEVSLFFFFC